MIDREKYKQTTRYQFYALSAFGIVMILWSVLFEIDIISNAEGQIIPLGEVKTIQHLEGGIIDQILVKESELVKKGQPLVILAATASEVEVDEVKVQIDAQIIKSIRIEAEINNVFSIAHKFFILRRDNDCFIVFYQLFNYLIY